MARQWRLESLLLLSLIAFLTVRCVLYTLSSHGQPHSRGDTRRYDKTGEYHGTGTNSNRSHSGKKRTHKVNHVSTSRQTPAPITLTNLTITEIPQCHVCHVVDLNTSTSEGFDCVLMKFEPRTPVCLYSSKRDIYVSRSLKMSGVWERKTVLNFQSWLKKDQEIGVIDIGANLGVYTLVAAAMGRNVLAVEPNVENIARLRKAIQKGGLGNNITLLQNAVGDKVGIANIKYSSNNQGDTQIGTQQRNITAVNDTLVSSGKRYATVITMNHLTSYCKFKQAVMKMDIQGFEHKAFQHADILFRQVKVHQILMEWEMLTQYANPRKDPTSRIMVRQMIEFFTSRGYKPKDTAGGNINPHSWHRWPINVVWHLQTGDS